MMRSSPRNPWVQVALTLVLTVAALAVLAAAVDMDPPATASAGHEPAAAEPAQGGGPGASTAHTQHPGGAHAASRMGAFDRLAPTKLDDLACFRCHGLEEYEHGEKFPHATHRQEGAGHCHRCHAFQGHFEVTIRKATCEECH